MWVLMFSTRIKRDASVSEGIGVELKESIYLNDR